MARLTSIPHSPRSYMYSSERINLNPSSPLYDAQASLVDVPRLEILALWAAYQEATLVKRKSWKAMMDTGKDPSKDLISFFGFDWHQGFM